VVKLQFGEKHSHTLEESDIKKTSDAVKNAVKSHLICGYKACQVNSEFKKEFSGAGFGVEQLKLQNVGNMRRELMKELKI
jgi:hypothetical protein